MSPTPPIVSIGHNSIHVVMWSIRITLAELRRSFPAPFCNKAASSSANSSLNKRLQGCTPPETSHSFFSPTDILPPLEPRTKIQSCTLGGARIQGTRMWSTILPGLGPDLFPLRGCLAPAGHRALVFLSGALHPPLSGVEVTTTGITAYVNVCRPESTRRTAELPPHPRWEWVVMGRQSSIT